MSDISGARALRILHVFRAPVGGLFRHVVDLARGQIARGHQVGIICDSSTGGARTDQVFAEIEGELALGPTRIPMSRYPALSDITAQRAVNALRARIKPDVVHGHGSKGGVYARLPARFLPKRDYISAYTPHGGSFNYRPGSPAHHLYMTIERLLETGTDMFCFESAYIGQCFEAYIGHKPRTGHRVVCNGVSEAEFAPIDPSGATFDLVYLGEMRAAKGIDTLIDALVLLGQRDGLRPRVLLVGAGPDDAALRTMAQQRGVGEQCVFEPPAAIRATLARARIMVIPSRTESLPYVVLETAAAAQPLITTDVGGIKEIFGPDHSSRLIRANEPTLLADAIRTALTTAEAERHRQATELAAYVRQNFRVEQMVDDILAAYRSALTQRGLA